MRYKIIERSEKYCPKCEKTLTVDNFYKEKARHDGLNAYCKQCKIAVNENWRKLNPEKAKKSQLATRRKIEYGISQKDFDKIMIAQNNRCAICKIDINNSSHVDHNHSTGNVRGILCHNCNKGLGMFKDNIEFLQSAIDYLNITHQ